MKSVIALALIPECDLMLALEALYATTTENQLHSYLSYSEKTWVEEFVRGILRKDPDFKPAIWNQFSNAANGNQTTNNSLKDSIEFFKYEWVLLNPVSKFIQRKRKEQKKIV